MLKPPLDMRIVVPDVADLFHCLVVYSDEEFCAPKVATRTVDCPENAASFQVERSAMSLLVEGSAADVGGKLHGGRRARPRRNEAHRSEV